MWDLLWCFAGPTWPTSNKPIWLHVRDTLTSARHDKNVAQCANGLCMQSWQRLRLREVTICIQVQWNYINSVR